MHEILEHIADYINVLARSHDSTTQANDRSAYTKHLAEAARWVGMVKQGCSIEELQKRMSEEQASFGRAFLSDVEGENSESAFHRVLRFVESRKTHSAP
jgi:hypothetical protein